MFLWSTAEFFVVGVNVSGNDKCYFVKKPKKTPKKPLQFYQKFFEPHIINMLGAVVVVIVW